MISPTMKSCRIQILSLILAGLISMPAHAEVIPGRWEKVSALEMTLPITVKLKNGDRIKGQFRGLSPSDLELLSPAGWAAIPRTDIQTITLPSKDGLRDGAWKGAVPGLAFAGGIALIGIARDAGEESNSEIAFQALALGGLLAGIGAVIGVAADAVIKTEGIVLYIAPGTPRRSKHKDSEWWDGSPAIKAKTPNPSK